MEFDLPLSPTELIACVEREIKMREQVYPRWVEARKMSQRKADYELRCMKAVRDALKVAAPAPRAALKNHCPRCGMVHHDPNLDECYAAP